MSLCLWVIEHSRTLKTGTTAIHLTIVTSILVVVALILLTVFLRRISFLDERHGRLFSRLVTKVTLPAFIFTVLAQTELRLDEVELAFLMVSATLVCLALGWGIARSLRLNRPQTGAVILMTGFGGSSSLGFPIVDRVFSGDNAALTEVAAISGLGVQPIMFTLGTLIAIHFGTEERGQGGPFSALADYVKSPIFIAFVGGLLFSLAVPPGENAVYRGVMDGLHVIGNANTLFVTLSVGLLLHFGRLSDIVVIAVLVGVTKLIVMPILAWLPTLSMTFPDWQVQVLVLEAAMPSTMLPVAFCAVHGCDAQLAARLVFATTVASAITLPIVFSLLT